MQNPAYTIIERLGGFDAVGAVLQKHPTTIRKWCYPKERGGTDGLIPMESAVALLRYAKSKKIKIRPEHFFPLIEGVSENA